MDSGRSEVNLAQFKDHFDLINEELYKVFNSRVPVVEEIGRHALLGNGKRLRPLIFILSCELCHYRQDDRYHLSTIFEYIHTASLLHDDVLDNAELRRNRPSANQIWGSHAAVLEGDFLFSKAMAIATGTGSVPFLEKIADTVIQMTEGQILELVNTDNWYMDRDLYMEIITAKTAMLMSTACTCGAIISGADRETTESLARFGLCAGIAFQLIDDLLDYTSTREVFGKPVGKDLREGKVTLPLIYTLEQLETKEQKRLKGLFRDHGHAEEDIRYVMDLVRNTGAIERVLEEARAHVDKAVESLNLFSDSPTKRDLVVLSRHIIDRTK